MRFNVRSLRVLDFYWENFELLPKVLKVILKATGSHEWASVNALNYQLRTFDIPIDDLAPQFDGYRILHLSDLHIDEIRDGGESLFQLISELEYDLCVLTGDFRFDTYGSADLVMSRMTKLMEVLRCPDGVVGILGNHDFIEMVPGFEAMGIRMLLNESLPVERNGDRLWIVGLDDAHYYKVKIGRAHV